MSKKDKIMVDIYNAPVYDGISKPPMGWSSWNCFKINIDEKQLLDIGDAMVKSGLKDAGYGFLNIDDCWHSSQRDEKGEWQGDYQRFPSGIPYLISALNEKGLKVGLYSSNGTLTCEDLPASLGREKEDAYTLAKWGAEYFKYDFCHHRHIPINTPHIVKIALNLGEFEVMCKAEEGKLFGKAKLAYKKEVAYVKGLEKNRGMVSFTLEVPEDGEYALTLTYLKGSPKDAFIMARANGGKPLWLNIPACKIFNTYARVQTRICLKKGVNTIDLFNPVSCRHDSAMLQYRNMGEMLKEAVKRVADERGVPEKPIVYSICECGYNKPYRWGKTAGNLWRTTPDIRPWWPWINIIYGHNVKLYKHSVKGGYNDPDMLEVGNGKLSYEENKTHFSLWCMMNAPLVLGNDLRKFIKEDGSADLDNPVLKILTNKEMIAINQDDLGVACKPLSRSIFGDVLAKPLSDGHAVCLFNKSPFARKMTISLSALAKDEYFAFEKKKGYKTREIWSGIEGRTEDKISIKIKAHGCAVFKVLEE